MYAGLGRSGCRRHPAGVSATRTIPSERGSGLEDGEVVLWRDRRAPPFMQLAVAPAAVLVVSGVAVANVLVTPLLIVAGVAVIVLARRLAAGRYLEDQLLTDRRVLVAPRAGAAYGMRLEDIESAEMKEMKVIFRGDGQQLRFSFVRKQRALRRALAAAAPQIAFEQHWDPHCSTCGVRW
jgi:hypothetical protein